VHPIILQFGRLTVTSYGVMVALAFLAGLWTASRRSPRSGISGEKVLDLGPWLIIGAILGSRALYVVSYWQEDFAGKPLVTMLMVWRGGLVYYGGLIGASLACVLYARLKQVPLWKFADVLAPSVALGCVFGRLGCLLNGCCYGSKCHLPWAITFPATSVTAPPGVPLHPTQIYDSLLNLVLYMFLAWLYRRKKFDGQIFATYLVGYAIFRSIVEVFRGDYAQHYLGGWATPAQLVSIGILGAGLALLYVLSRFEAKQKTRMADHA
jgi:phosphatidylglycerol:prolipoprotein diacylglycerol transferase